MIAGKETRETAVAMRKSMGKLGAKLTVWEQRRAWADGMVQKTPKYSYAVARRGRLFFFF
jgi:hypothetical protein